MAHIVSAYLHVVDMVSVPGGAEELISKSQDQDVLDHLLTQVVVNSENFVLGPVWAQCSLQLSRATKVFSEGLLDLSTEIRQLFKMEIL
jgi:hypothetical protein